jgi:hypothetical protein
MLTLRLALLALLLSVLQPIAVAATGAPSTLRYTISSNGKLAGTEVDRYLPDGRVECTFEFNDRGRGPKISANYSVDENGLLTRVDDRQRLPEGSC